MSTLSRTDRNFPDSVNRPYLDFQWGHQKSDLYIRILTCHLSRVRKNLLRAKRCKPPDSFFYGLLPLQTSFGLKLDSMSQVSRFCKSSLLAPPRRKPNCHRPYDPSGLSTASRGLLQFGYRLGGARRLLRTEAKPRWFRRAKQKIERQYDE